MDFLNPKIEQYSSLAKEIENYIALNKLDKAQQKLEEYSSAINNSAKYCYKAILNFQNGDVEGAIHELKEGAKEHPFSFNIHYNLGFMYNANQEPELALESFFYAFKYNLSEEDNRVALQEIENIIADSNSEKIKTSSITQERIEELKGTLNQKDARIYPIDINGKSLIRKPQEKGTTNEYFINTYNSGSISDMDMYSKTFLKVN